MSKGNFKAFTLSLIIHLSIVIALVSLSKPTSDPEKTKSKPVTSYLLIPPPKNTQKTSDTIDDGDNNLTESTLKREISPSPTDLKSEQDVQSEIVPNAASDETVQERQEREAEQKTTKKAIQTNPAQFIQNLNSEAINELAKNARITRGRPPLSSDSTSGSNNQREETPAQSFG
ncbi:MAG: cell envelope integrity protein TolA, partial [Pseudomonadota bacterium]